MQQNYYIFIVACLNYLTLPLVNMDSKKVVPGGGMTLPAKVRDILKDFKIPILGPIWHLIMKAGTIAISKA